MEIAIRALSPAVNDTFTALTCIDWLSDGLGKLSARWEPRHTYRDAEGYIRLITAGISYRRLIERAFDKIRQAGAGMPAVMIRQIEALTRVMSQTTTDAQRTVLIVQATVIMGSSERSIAEPTDLADVRRAYEALVAAAAAMDGEPAADRHPSTGPSRAFPTQHQQ